MTLETFEGLRGAVLVLLAVCTHAFAFRVGMFVARVRLAILVERMNREERQAKGVPVNLYRKADDGKAPN